MPADRLALYFGFGHGGHSLRFPTGGRAVLRDVPRFPWPIGLLDGGLLRNANVSDEPDGRVHWTCGGATDFWHAFVWWDRSGDPRGASNSGFYVRGFDMSPIESRAAAFAFACAVWPNVVERQKFPLVLIEGGS